jgi:hypothetical protein
MDLSKLNANEKLALYGAAAGILGAIVAAVGGWGGALWFTLILSIAMIVILFLPQWSPQTSLPGSKGSLMLIVGGLAGLSALLALLSLFSVLGFMALYNAMAPIGILLGIAGGLLMGWASWQQFQSEGGKFNLGTTASAAPSSAAPPPPAPMSSAPPPPPAAPAAPEAPDTTNDPNRP